MTRPPDSGGEALILLEQHVDVAIVVSDVVMPGSVTSLTKKVRGLLDSRV